MSQLRLNGSLATKAAWVGTLARADAQRASVGADHHALMGADRVDAEELEAMPGEQIIALRRMHRTRSSLWNLPLRPQSHSKYCCRS